MNYGILSDNILLKDLLKRSVINPVMVLNSELKRFGATFNENVIRAVAISQKYSGYMSRKVAS